MDNADALLRWKQVAARLNISRSSLQRLRSEDPTFPKPIKLGRGIFLVRARDLDAWFRRQELASMEATQIESI